MARYKEYSYNQSKLIPIYFSKQILPGTFEYALNYLLDNELDLSVFDSKYKNTEAGMELPDADLKIGAAGKWQHFQKDFFYRIVGWTLKPYKGGETG
jgi:hypothetical protein